MWRMCALMFALLFAAPVLADSWPMPTQKTYLSSDCSKRLTIFPRKIESQLSYFQDKVAGKSPAGGEYEATVARAVLEQLAGDEWTSMAEFPLVNDVAPVSALVSNSGNYLITFDNWHSLGYGDDVIVIYGKSGNVIRALGLKEILPDTYIEELPHSVSSIQWGGGHQFSQDERTLLLSVRLPGGYFRPDGPDTVTFVVDLETGAVTPPADPKWNRILRKIAEHSHASGQ